MAKTRYLVPFILAMTVFFVPRASADTVVFDSFGPGFSFNGTIGATICGAQHPRACGQGTVAAAGFVPTTTVALSQIAVVLSTTFGTNSVIVMLLPDVSGLPGTTAIETWSVTGLGGNPAVSFLSSTVNPNLAAGTQYWIAAFPGAPDTVAVWSFANSPGLGAFSQSGGVTWTASTCCLPPVVQVSGTTPVTPVPEPTTIVLLSTGLVCGLLTRRKAVPSTN